MSQSLDEKEKSQQDSSPSTLHIDKDIDPVAEKRLLHKLDLALLPLFTLLYTTSFIDKTAIGETRAHPCPDVPYAQTKLPSRQC
jgi:MFS transporter, ACS family, DAL5 transporter family protein